MSAQKDKMIFDLRRGRENDIWCQQGKIKSDSISGQEDKIRFHVRRGR
jgi:hypothetical protein